MIAVATWMKFSPIKFVESLRRSHALRGILVTNACGALVPVCRSGIRPTGVSRYALAIPFVLLLTPMQNVSAGNVVFEDPGKFLMVEGGSCGQGGASGVLRLPGSMQIPDEYASGMATVVLNGWRLGYLGDDHKLQSARAVISEPRLNGRSLQWEAVGVLHDGAGFLDLSEAIDDPYEFCYRYLAFPWDRADIHALLDPQSKGIIDKTPPR